MKTKIILGGLAAVVLAGLLVAGMWWLRRPQVITLADGDKLTLLGVEYGRHHKTPKVPKVQGAGPRMGGGPGAFDTPEAALVVWVLSEHKPDGWPNYQLLVSDPAETGAVMSYGMVNNQQLNPKTMVLGLQLAAFPRRVRNSSSSPTRSADPFPPGRRTRCPTRSPTAIWT
jgi:hypothetical protein